MTLFHLMGKEIAAEKDKCSKAGLHLRQQKVFIFGAVQTQFSSVAFLPVGIEVEDESDPSCAGTAVVVDMLIISSAGRIQGKVRFKSLETQIKILIQLLAQNFKLRQELLLQIRAGVLFQPQSEITANFRVHSLCGRVSDGSFAQLAGRMKALTLLGERLTKILWENPGRHGPVMVREVIKHSIEICEIDLILLQSVAILCR